MNRILAIGLAATVSLATMAVPAMAASPANAAATASSANWPERPIRLVVPFPPGGATDIVGRIIGEQLTRELGQSVIVENKAGAAGSIGMSDVSRQPGDGYTFAVITDSIPLQDILNAKLDWSMKSFRGVTRIATSPEALVVRPSFPARTVADFVALARKEPGKLTFAASSAGSIHHLAGELFKRITATSMMHVAYKGGGQSIVDLAAGHVDSAFIGVAPVIDQVRAGNLRILAVTGESRSAILPDVPTFAEAGFADFDVELWIGLVARDSTPDAIVERMQKAVARALENPQTRERLATLGFRPVGDTPAAFDPWLRQQQARWAKVIESLGSLKP